MARSFRNETITSNLNGMDTMKNLIFALCLSLSLPFLAQAETPSTVSTAETLNTFININLDDAEKMAEILVGVGPAIAERIVAYRTENGPFSTIEELLNVKGFGVKKMEANLNLLKI